MSVYKGKSGTYRYDFTIEGRRFTHTTDCRSRRDALAEERRAKKRERERMSAEARVGVALDLASVGARYAASKGEPRALVREIALLVSHFGPDKPVTEITHGDAAGLVAWRRGHTRGEGGSLLEGSTVNLTTTTLRRVLDHAAAEGVRPVQWAKLKQKERVRTRELVGDEEQRLDAATREDYAPIFAFGKLTGWRRREWLLRWSEVDWRAELIRKVGKGGKLRTKRITPAVREILEPLIGDHPEHVFTYRAQSSGKNPRTGVRYVEGERYPITYTGLGSAWHRLRARAGVEDFRLHDFRHTYASQLLRQERNLALVQKALGHSSIKTASRYAHVLTEDVDAAQERYEQARTNPRTVEQQAA